MIVGHYLEDGSIVREADGATIPADPFNRDYRALLGRAEAGDTITPFTADQSTLWAALRLERDARLTAADWTQMPDSPLSDDAKAAWAAYRQALRDLPEVTSDPANPHWPVAPS